MKTFKVGDEELSLDLTLIERFDYIAKLANQLNAPICRIFEAYRFDKISFDDMLFVMVVYLLKNNHHILELYSDALKKTIPDEFLTGFLNWKEKN